MIKTPKHACEANLMLCENEESVFQACKICGTTFPAPFKEAYKRLPVFLVAGFDPLRHLTTGDLIEMVRVEIDFFEQGEDSDIKTRHQLHQAELFIEAVTG